MQSSCFHSLRGETDGPAALLGLRLAECYFPANPGQRTFHAHHCVLHVHVLPPERQHFSLSHTGVDGQDIECFEAISSGCFAEPARFVRRESDHLLRNRSWWLHHVCYVSRDEVPRYGLREASAQDVMHLV